MYGEGCGQGRFFFFVKIEDIKACVYVAGNTVLERTTYRVGKMGNNSRYHTQKSKMYLCILGCHWGHTDSHSSTEYTSHYLEGSFCALTLGIKFEFFHFVNISTYFILVWWTLTTSAIVELLVFPVFIKIKMQRRRICEISIYAHAHYLNSLKIKLSYMSNLWEYLYWVIVFLYDGLEIFKNKLNFFSFFVYPH